MAYNHDHHHHHQARVETPVSPLVPSYSLPHSANVQALRQGGRYEAHNYDLSHPLVSPIMSRSPSVSSDRFSTVSALSTQLPSNPTNVSPAPSYVAAFAATQVLSEHGVGSRRRFNNDEDDDDEAYTPTTREDATFSPASLALVNGFLDQLLFSFLSYAKSTSLGALRPAVKEVLRSRLASEAIASADEELHELLAGGDDDEHADERQLSAEQKRLWDLELVWKRTRLRVMVYIRLGEMEDEDEERYVKEDNLFQGFERRFSSTTGLVSWAAAIFLTSILEYVAEQVIQASGQIAYNRIRRQSRRPPSTLPQPGTVSAVTGGVTVEDFDIERVALDSLLGRVWRTWRKSSRNSGPLTSPTKRHAGDTFEQDPRNTAAMNQNRDSLSPVVNSTNGSSSQPSTATEVPYAPEDRAEDLPNPEYPEHVLAANIPLPVGEHQRDIDEIEVPGLAIDPDEAADQGVETPTGPHILRRNSLTGSAPFQDSRQSTTVFDSQASRPTNAAKPGLERRRSRSVPIQPRTPTRYLTTNFVNGNDDEEEVTSEGWHTPSDVKSLLDQVVDGAPEDKKDTGVAPGATILETAIAGVSAATSAAASAVHGTTSERRKSGPAIRIDTRDGTELDKQKHLVDIKTLGIPPVGPQVLPKSEKEASRQVSPVVESTATTPASTVSARPAVSQNAEDQVRTGQEPVDESVPPEQTGETTGDSDNLAEENSSIGVASTSDAAVSSPNIEEPQRKSLDRARDPDSRPTEPEQPSAPIPSEVTPRTGDSTSQERDDASHTSRDISQERLSHPGATALATPEKSSSQTSLPQGHQASDLSSTASGAVNAGPEKAQWRKSVSAAIEKSSLLRAPSKSRSRSNSDLDGKDVAVKDHPVIQRISSMRKNGKVEDEWDKPLTSASIRGPEDFDMFVQGGDTVKYTLTPENVRDNPDPPGATSSTKMASTVGMPMPSQKTPSPPLETRAGRSHSVKQATSAGVSPEEPAKPRLSSAEREARAEKRRSISRPPVRNTSVHRKSGLIAREPQVQTESTRDIADFIRSTGPSPAAEVLQHSRNRSTTSLQSFRDSSIFRSRSRSPGARSTRSLSRSASQTAGVPPVPPMPLSRGRSAMQPRDATSASEGNSALIDFIRSGPADTSKRRISRSVAPFRTTMDSDQMADWKDKVASQPDLVPSTTLGAPSSASVNGSNRTSTNSRAPLVNGASDAIETVHPAHSGVPQTLSALRTTSASASGDGGRRRYRNKDPYAIDISDEDDDLLTALPKNTRVEESLIDFLKSSEPPSKIPPRSASSAPATDRNTTNGTVRRSSVQPLLTHGADIVTGGRRPSLLSNTSRNLTSSHSSTSVASRPSQFGTATSITGGPKAKLEARTPSFRTDREKAQSNNTKDLADFLRSSGPTGVASDPLSAPAPTVGRKSIIRMPSSSKKGEKGKATRDESEKPRRKSFFSLFSRSNSRSGKTYLDMR